MLSEQHYQFQAKSVRHKRVLSILFVGLHMMHNTRLMLPDEYIKIAEQEFQCLIIKH